MQEIIKDIFAVIGILFVLTVFCRMIFYRPRRGLNDPIATKEQISAVLKRDGKIIKRID